MFVPGLSTADRQAFYAGEKVFVRPAVWVLCKEMTGDRICSDRTAAVTDGQVFALDAIVVTRNMLWPLLKTLTRLAVFQYVGKTVVIENISKPVIGIAGDPAIALRHMTTGVDSDQAIDTIITPDAG